jgi:hypothetical protein
MVDGGQRRTALQPEVGIHRQPTPRQRSGAQVLIKKVGLANAPGGEQSQGPAGLRLQQAQVALRKFRTVNADGIEFAHAPIVV